MASRKKAKTKAKVPARLAAKPVILKAAKIPAQAAKLTAAAKKPAPLSKKAAAGKKKQQPVELQLSKIRKQQEREEKSLRRIEKEEHVIARELKGVEKQVARGVSLTGKIEGEERKIEDMLRREEAMLRRLQDKEDEIGESVMKIGSIVITRSQFIDITRAAAGAFLAFGISLRYFDVFSMKINEIQFVGILLLILAISGILIYMREKEQVKKLGRRYIAGRVAMLYIICIIVELLSFAVFGMLSLEDIPKLAEMLVVGSYVTMAGAVAFSLL